jgi:hypothetical protein
MAETTNPISGPYSVPMVKYHSGPAKYQKIVTVTGAMLPFYATGSNSGAIAASTNDNSNEVTITLANYNSSVNGSISSGGDMSLSDFANNIIYEIGVYSISGSLSGGKHIHLFYA